MMATSIQMMAEAAHELSKMDIVEYHFHQITTSPSEPKICGNSLIDFGELCDDGNSVQGDGCDASCQIEYGFKCDNSKHPSFCFPYCGDGKRELLPFYEECDDENNLSMDGCDKSCRVETNYLCDNSTGVDICKTKFLPPIITSSIFDLNKFQLITSFDQTMMTQNITEFDMSIDASGPNSPYLLSWSASFTQKKLVISFSVSPALLGGEKEKIIMQIINVQKFKSEYEIPMIAPQLLNYVVSITRVKNLRRCSETDHIIFVRDLNPIGGKGTYSAQYQNSTSCAFSFSCVSSGTAYVITRTLQ